MPSRPLEDKEDLRLGQISMPVYASHLLNAFLLAVVSVILLQRVAPSVGLVDLPNARKVHEGGIPLIGGLAMFIALLLAMLFLDPALRAPWEFVAGLSLLVFLGVLDDRYELGARLKLLVQVGTALVLVLPNWRVITHLLAHGEWQLHSLALPFTVLFVVGLINAFNMIDGLDGLAGGAAAAAFFWLAVVAAGAGLAHQAMLLLLLFATLGFLVFNARHPWRSRATVFMGDAGSMMLGAAIAFFIVVLAGGPEPAAPFPALLWVCAIPAIDTLSLIVRRLRADRSPFAADRRHLHHLLLDRGFSPQSATAVIVGLCFALGAIGVASAHIGVPDAAMALGLLALVAVHTVFVCSRPTGAATSGGTASAGIFPSPSIKDGNP